MENTLEIILSENTFNLETEAKDLIKNCQHYGSHYTYLIRGENGEVRAVEKKTFSGDGLDALVREQEGLRWYATKLGRDISDVIESFEKNRSYCKIRLPYHKGDVLSKLVRPDLVIQKMQLAVEHYLKVFGGDNFRYSHGDYFIGNIVFKENAVNWVIDWEHFNDELPPGYDAVNCVVEVFLSYWKKDKSFSRSSIEFARNCLRRVEKETGLDRMAVKYPAQWCRDTALNHKHIWRLQYNKLPHIACSNRTCVKIDKILGI